MLFGLKKLNVWLLMAFGSNPPEEGPPLPSCDDDGFKKFEDIWLTLLGSKFGVWLPDPPLELLLLDPPLPGCEAPPPPRNADGLVNIFGTVICEPPLELEPLVDEDDEEEPELVPL